MSTLAHNPFRCHFTCMYLFTKGIEYVEKCHRGLLRATRGIKIFAMISLRRDLEVVKSPSKYLIARVSIYHSSVTQK